MTRRPLLLHRERAEGVDQRLLDFIDWWAKEGPFPMLVDPKGGVRYDEAVQAELYRKKVSNARHLKETPHGRGAAVDLWPCVLGAAGQAIAILTRDHEALRQYGELAKGRGLVWGGDFVNSKGLPWPDEAHVECPDWRSLPFPPKGR